MAFMRIGNAEFNGCPKCRSTNFKASSLRVENNKLVSCGVECLDCGYSDDGEGAKPADLLLGLRR